jgi:hypothetical protein
MFSSNKSKKIDLSFLQYYKEEDIQPEYITIEQIKQRHKCIAQSELECLKLFLFLNYKVLSEEDKKQVMKTIDILYNKESEKYKSAISYIEQCREHQPESTQESSP